MVNGSSIFQDIDRPGIRKRKVEALNELSIDKSKAKKEVSGFKTKEKEKIRERKIITKARIGIEKEKLKKSISIRKKQKSIINFFSKGTNLPKGQKRSLPSGLVSRNQLTGTSGDPFKKGKLRNPFI